MYLERQAQIKMESEVGALIFDETITVVRKKYFYYSNIFSIENAAKFLEHTKINDHAVKLEENKQPSFCLIYSLEPVELKTLKMYIKTNLVNGFI